MTKKKIDFEDVANNLAQELVEANEALLRERADAANVRRRADEDRVKMAGFYKASVVRELLPFIDNLDRALKHEPIQKSEPESPDSKKWYEWALGIQALQKQLLTILEKFGVEKIKTVGEPFDPNLHDAVMMEDLLESEEGTQETVSEELQSGYVLKEEILRHAMVKVKMQ
jgi:molecular chaperone GrpE